MAEKKKTVLITGAAGGVGRATVAYFAARGFQVIGVDRSPYYESFPEDGLYIQADISVPENLEMIYEKANQFSETLDVLVNNAAFQVTKPLIETSVEEWDAVMGSNLRSVFLGVKLAYPMLKAEGAGRSLTSPRSMPLLLLLTLRPMPRARGTAGADQSDGDRIRAG